jgi:uncharacterized cupredoxin-like copper-binding protein
MNKIVIEFPRGENLRIIILTAAVPDEAEVMTSSPVRVVLNDAHLIESIESLDESSANSESVTQDNTIELDGSDMEDDRPNGLENNDHDDDDETDVVQNDLVIISQVGTR